VTGAALRMTWLHFFVAGAILLWKHGLEKTQNAWVLYQAISSARSFPLLKEVSQNCFIFDVANLKN